MNLAQSLLSGDRRALARALTLVENEQPEARTLLAELFTHAGRAHLIGITGPPGSGKSTLVNGLTRRLRSAGETVAILAVDPTSPFSGGAILGDRIRMRDLAGDSGVFIRSMATRGSLGGLARTTGDAVDVLDAAGFDRVLVETVGAGQSEVDVASVAHTTVVVEAPGLGDDIQAIKAGLLEIADVLVLNKADRPEADAAYRALRAMLALAAATRPADRGGHHKSDAAMRSAGESATRATTSEPAAAAWQTRLLKTVALDGDGLDALLGALDDHRAYLHDSGELAQRQRARIRAVLEARLRVRLFEDFMRTVDGERFEALVEATLARKTDLYSSIDELFALRGSSCGRGSA